MKQFKVVRKKRQTCKWTQKRKHAQTNITYRQTINKALARIFFFYFDLVSLAFCVHSYATTNLDTIHRYRKKENTQQNIPATQNVITQDAFKVKDG